MPAKYFANDVIFIEKFAAEETFPATLKVEKFSIKIASLAKYFAGAERNDEVENGR